MSAETVGWTFKKSPYRGALFALHLAVADIVNDTHGYQLWASVSNLAAKARVSERSARAGLAQMVEDGLLVKVAERPGAPTTYRFEMPDDPCTSCTPAATAPLHVVPPTPANERDTPATDRATPAVAAPELKNSREIPRGTRTLVGFDAFWRAFPRKESKGTARTEWHRAIRKKAPADILIAAQAYADDPNRKQKFTKSPAKWLEGECWDDERDTGRTESNGTRAAKGLLHRSGTPLKELSQ